MSQSSRNTQYLVKCVSLFVLTVLSSSNILLLRYSRTVSQKKYLISTAIAVGEIAKTILSLLIFWTQSKFSVSSLVSLKNDIIKKPRDTFKLAIPAGLYTLQNNLLFVALSNLDAATYQVTYQLKIITTALFSVWLLNKKLDSLKWASLVILMAGVCLIQWPTDITNLNTDKNMRERLVGLAAIIVACFCSAFAGIYFEIIVKTSPVSLWVRNIQLGSFGFLIALASVLINDFQAVRDDGFFQGYDTIVWCAVAQHSALGLVVAVVVKYADNILKGFATSISIIISAILSCFLLQDFLPTSLFYFGSTLVLVASFMYGYEGKKESVDSSRQH